MIRYILSTLLVVMFVFTAHAEVEKGNEYTAFEVIQTEAEGSGVRVSWILSCEMANFAAQSQQEFVVRFISKSDKKRLDVGMDDVDWTYTPAFSSDSSSLYVEEGLEGGVDYLFGVGFANGVDPSSYAEYSWSDKSKVTTNEGWGISKVLTLIGALGFFIFGMKIMSEGIQKLAGTKLRNILSKATANRFAGILTGFTTTSIIQSSSATTVMVVSFVNAGLLTLRQAIGVIMGANIGTTVTSFLILVFAFGKFSISDYSLPIIAIGMPLMFFNKSSMKSLGEFLIGFAILFMGLDALKDVMSFIKDDPTFLSDFVEPLTQFGYFSVIIFVLIGTLLTIVVQSSSAAMSITLTLVGTSGLPLEFAAAIILGENIGTTVTANIAAMIGNVHAKRAARAHLLFNLIGVVWMLFLFYPFLDFVSYLISDTFFSSLLVEGDGDSESRWSLAVFHLVFNIINTALLIGFVIKLEQVVVKLVASKDDGDEIIKLDFMNVPMGSTAELSILEAKKEVVKFGVIASRMNGFVNNLLNTSEKKVKKEMHTKLKKYEEITDKVEIEIANYLGKSAQLEMSSATATKVRSMLSITNDLERIGDIFYQMGKLIERKDENQAWFAPEQREGINRMSKTIDEAFDIMIENLNGEYGEISIERAVEKEKEINVLRNELRKAHLSSITDPLYNAKSGMTYNNLFSSLEKVGDHIINVSEAVAGKI